METGHSPWKLDILPFFFLWSCLSDSCLFTKPKFIAVYQVPGVEVLQFEVRYLLLQNTVDTAAHRYSQDSKPGSLAAWQWINRTVQRRTNMGAGSSVQAFEASSQIVLSPEQKKHLQSLYDKHKQDDHLSVTQILSEVDEQHLNINEKQYIRFVSKQIALELTELALRDAILSLSRNTSLASTFTPEEKEEREEKEDQETRESKESTTNEGGSKSKK